MCSARFGKNRRLLDKRAFDRVFAKPKRISMGPFLLLVRKSNQQASRLGLAIAKKRVNLASDRNRIKRHIRESFRQANLSHVDIVALSGKGLQTISSKDLREKLQLAWQKVRAICND